MNEVRFAKFIALVILLLTVFQITQAWGEDKRDVIIELFRQYNSQLSTEELNSIVDAVFEAGLEFEISPEIIAAIIVRESGAKPRAISKTGDYGLMQIHWSAHKRDIMKLYPQVKCREDLFDPAVNISMGTRIFAEYYSRKKTLRDALIRYNGGGTVLAQRVLQTMNTLKN